MGYQISYNNVAAPEIKDGKRPKRFTAAILVLIVVVLALAFQAIELPWVQNYLIPGDDAVTAAALEGMVKDFKEGASFIDAITAFCEEIIAHAQ